MYGSEKSMGPVPCMVLKSLWDGSHNSHGTSKYRSFLQLYIKFWFIKSHVWFLKVYGTGPMCGSERPMGPVPCYDFRHLWDWSHRLLTTDIHGTLKDSYWVPCMVLRSLWDRSHILISDTYGTDPIDCFVISMRLYFQCLSIESHVWFWDTYGTGPMLWSQTPMGLIP